jgi:hypothetical protein
MGREPTAVETSGRAVRAEPTRVAAAGSSDTLEHPDPEAPNDRFERELRPD